MAATATTNVQTFDGRYILPSTTVVFKDDLITSIGSNPGVTSEPTSVKSS
jgi:hypothetical protein